MRSVFGKYWALLLVGVSVQSVVNIAVLVQILGLTNSLAQLCFNLINDWAPTLSAASVASAVVAAFITIIDWAPTLSAAAAASAVVAVSMTIIESRRRNQSLGMVRNWAADAVLKLTTASKEESVAKRLADWEERLQIIETESGSALASARAIGGSLEPKVNKAVKTLLEFEDYFGNHAEPDDVKALLKTTVITFKEVINSTSDSQ